MEKSFCSVFLNELIISELQDNFSLFYWSNDFSKSQKLRNSEKQSKNFFCMKNYLIILR